MKGFVFAVFAVAFTFFLMSQYGPETLLKVFTDFLVWFLGLFLGCFYLANLFVISYVDSTYIFYCENFNTYLMRICIASYLYLNVEYTEHVRRNKMQTLKTFISKVIADGRVTIPKELREQEGINEGDFVEVQVKKVNMGVAV